MSTPEQDRAGPRVKVGATGLAIVTALIWLTSAIFGSLRDRPVAPPAAREGVVANLVASNAGDPAAEPLSDIGVAPSTLSNDSVPQAAGGVR